MDIFSGMMCQYFSSFLVLTIVLGGPTTTTSRTLSTTPKLYSRQYSNTTGQIIDMLITQDSNPSQNMLTSTTSDEIKLTYDLKDRVRAQETRKASCLTVAEMSVCPWKYVSTMNADRIPPVFYEAHCLSDTPKNINGSSNIRCTPVMVSFLMKYRVVNNNYKTVYENHPAACTPVISC